MRSFRNVSSNEEPNDSVYFQMSATCEKGQLFHWTHLAFSGLYLWKLLMWFSAIIMFQVQNNNSQNLLMYRDSHHYSGSHRLDDEAGSIFGMCCHFPQHNISKFQLLLKKDSLQNLKLNLPHFHVNFQSRKRRGLYCSCRQQWGLQVVLSHLKRHKKQPCLILGMYWGKLTVFNSVKITYCLFCVFCWICSSQMPSAPSLSGMCHHNTAEIRN